AMVLIAALLGLYCAAPSLSRFRPRHWFTAVALALVLAVFGYFFNLSLKYAEDKLSPYFNRSSFPGRNSGVLGASFLHPICKGFQPCVSPRSLPFCSAFSLSPDSPRRP